MGPIPRRPAWDAAVFRENSEFPRERQRSSSFPRNDRVPIPGIANPYSSANNRPIKTWLWRFRPPCPDHNAIRAGEVRFLSHEPGILLDSSRARPWFRVFVGQLRTTRRRAEHSRTRRTHTHVHERRSKKHDERRRRLRFGGRACCDVASSERDPYAAGLQTGNNNTVEEG